jgi:hypothetical protein
MRHIYHNWHCLFLPSEIPAVHTLNLKRSKTQDVAESLYGESMDTLFAEGYSIRTVTVTISEVAG